MTEKRFNVFDIDGTIFLEDHKEGSYHIGEIGNVDVNCLNDIADRLNKLAEEKKELQQFKEKVFSWIDMHLQRLPTLRDDEFESDNEFADPSLYSGAIQILETMKRELKGD